MADWIGHLIASWPLWLIAIVLALIAIGWFFWALASAPYDWPYGRKEWWQDREKRQQYKASQSKTAPTKKKRKDS